MRLTLWVPESSSTVKVPQAAAPHPSTDPRTGPTPTLRTDASRTGPGLPRVLPVSRAATTAADPTVAAEQTASSPSTTSTSTSTTSTTTTVANGPVRGRHRGPDPHRRRPAALRPHLDPGRRRARARGRLIVLAHGLAGEPDKFDELSSAWAEAGYVVAAPRFPNSSVTGGAQVAGFTEQPALVTSVIDQLTDDPELRLDPDGWAWPASRSAGRRSTRSPPTPAAPTRASGAPPSSTGCGRGPSATTRSCRTRCRCSSCTASRTSSSPTPSTRSAGFAAAGRPRLAGGDAVQRARPALRGRRLGLRRPGRGSDPRPLGRRCSATTRPPPARIAADVEADGRATVETQAPLSQT